jgi:hypothetical protein
VRRLVAALAVAQDKDGESDDESSHSKYRCSRLRFGSFLTHHISHSEWLFEIETIAEEEVFMLLSQHAGNNESQAQINRLTD